MAVNLVDWVACDSVQGPTMQLCAILISSKSQLRQVSPCIIHLTQRDAESQVGKGGLPPPGLEVCRLEKSGGKPTFPTCDSASY